jgi:hypothetical protein
MYFKNKNRKYFIFIFKSHKSLLYIYFKLKFTVSHMSELRIQYFTPNEVTGNTQHLVMLTYQNQRTTYVMVSQQAAESFINWIVDHVAQLNNDAVTAESSI